MMSSPPIYAASPDVVCGAVGEEFVLLDTRSGTYFGLNAVGGRLWQLAEQEPRTLAAFCEVLEAEYDVARAMLERDFAALLEQLVARGLLQPA